MIEMRNVSLKEKMVVVLTAKKRPMTYMELVEEITTAYPEWWADASKRNRAQSDALAKLLGRIDLVQSEHRELFTFSRTEHVEFIELTPRVVEPEENDLASFKDKVLAVLRWCRSPLSYEEITDEIQKLYPEYWEELCSPWSSEDEVRKHLRLRIMLVLEENLDIFTANLVDDVRVRVGLVAPDIRITEEGIDFSHVPKEQLSLIWWTFPADQRTDGPYRIQVRAEVEEQVRATLSLGTYEPAIILGKFDHPDPALLEFAVHNALELRGRVKLDSYGYSYIESRSEEIAELVTCLTR